MMKSQNDNPAPLGIGRTLALAIYFFGKNFLSIIGLLAQLLVIIIGLGVLTSLLFDFKPDAVPILTDLVIFIAFAPIAVSVHRAIVLQEPINAKRYFPSFLQPRMWHFIGYAVVWIMAVGLANMVAPVAVLVVTIYFFGFSYVFPAVAVDEFQSLARSRKLMQGSMWRVFWCFFVVTIPIIIIAIIIEIREVDSVEPIVVSGVEFAALIVFGVLAILSAILMPAILSVAYKNSTGRVSVD